MQGLTLTLPQKSCINLVLQHNILGTLNWLKCAIASMSLLNTLVRVASAGKCFALSPLLLTCFGLRIGKSERLLLLTLKLSQGVLLLLTPLPMTLVIMLYVQPTALSVTLSRMQSIQVIFGLMHLILNYRASCSTICIASKWHLMQHLLVCLCRATCLMC